MTTTSAGIDTTTLPARHRGSRRPVVARLPQWWRDASAALLWLLLLLVAALWISGGGLQQMTSWAGATTSTGRLTGLLASALLLVQVFLMARVPFIEQAWGQDRLARTHRLVGFTSFTLMLAHIVLITIGYAAGTAAGVIGTAVDMVLTYPGMLLALAGTVALIMVVLTSLKRARARLRYESWHLIHLYAYLGAGLALPHQLWTGSDFLPNRAATIFWWGLYALALGAVLVYRVGAPAWRSLRYPLRVVDVRLEGTNATTVTIAGRGVDRWQVQPGQFFQWRFLDGPGWSRAHPFSLSAAPSGTLLRFTAAHAGDGTARLASLRVGTRVLIEGPYGRMHPGVRTSDRVLLMGAGIGIAPMLALLEGMPDVSPGKITVLHRVSGGHREPLEDETAAVAARLGHRYLRIEGHRVRERDSWLPAQAAHLTDVQALIQVVPDVADRDVFLCGAPAWMAAAQRALRQAGVPASRIHAELFTY